MPSKTTDSEEMQGVLRLARRVRTAEGARLYGKPIGTEINGDVDALEQERPMTIERIRSLQRQFSVAKAMGNTAAMRQVQREFVAAVSEFKKSRADINVLRELTASRGRNAQAASKAT